MKKSFVKVVAIFSIIFMSFFIKNNSVIALECTYSLPQTYMDKSGTPAQLKIDYTHKKVIKSINSSSNIESLMLKCTESGCKIGIKTSSRLYTSSDKSTYLANPYYIIDINKKLTGQKCPNYLELKAKTFDMDMPTNGYKLSTTDEKNYINSLTNIYYETKKSNDKFNNITINNDPSTGKDFATYLASVGDLVFINTSLKEKYPSDNFNKFKKIMNKVVQLIVL